MITVMSRFDRELIMDVRNIKAAMKFLKDQGKDILLMELGDIINEAKKNCEELLAYTGSWENLVKYAWNYEEKRSFNYSLEDAIKWFKANMPPDASGGCIYKKSLKTREIVLHHCFIDKDNNPKLDGSVPHRVVYTIQLSQDLEQQFQNKDMLVFK